MNTKRKLWKESKLYELTVTAQMSLLNRGKSDTMKDACFVWNST